MEERGKFQRKGGEKEHGCAGLADRRGRTRMRGIDGSKRKNTDAQDWRIEEMGEGGWGEVG
jgi:hypothetical protein